MAKIAIKPIETIDLEFADGTKKKVIFNVEALIHLHDNFGDLEPLARSAEKSPFDFASKLLYGGLKSAHPDITIEECESIVAGGGALLMNEILNAFMQNFESEISEIDRKKLKARILKVQK